MFMQWIAGLPACLAYFCLSVVAVILYLAIYMAITPHRGDYLERYADGLRKAGLPE